jgi:hypothetical protein
MARNVNTSAPEAEMTPMDWPLAAEITPEANRIMPNSSDAEASA